LLEHAALKFPHLAIKPALLAQHWIPGLHWLGFARALHSAPSDKEPGTAVTVDDGAGVNPPVGLRVILADADADADEDADADTDEDAKKPLQRPCWRLQVLKAHCWLLVHPAWKLPHRV
jgi:hypothetical protein